MGPPLRTSSLSSLPSSPQKSIPIPHFQQFDLPSLKLSPKTRRRPVFFQGPTAARLDDGTFVFKADGVEFTVEEVKLTGKLKDGTVFVKKCHGDTENDLFEFKTDEEQVIEGLDRTVTTMKKGEVALLTISPEYAFGSSESKQELATVPPNSTVYYEIELVSFVKEKESWDMNTEEKIEAAGKKKEEGNQLFKARKYVRASKRYEMAAKYIEYDTSFSEDKKKRSKALKVTCNLNNAACKLKLKDCKQVEKLCTKIESTNVKALYRRAQAYMNIDDLNLAELDINKALEIDPDNRDVKLEYKALKEKVKEFNKDAKFYGNMFAKMNKIQPLYSNVSLYVPGMLDDAEKVLVNVGTGYFIEMRTDREKRFNFSNIYSFKCGKGSYKDNLSQIGGPGFSRVVYCNEPDGLDANLRNYATNYVRTTKYIAATFLPKSLFEQIRRVANFYFLVTNILSFTSLAPYFAVSAIVPLIIVIGATMAKEGIENWRRKQQLARRGDQIYTQADIDEVRAEWATWVIANLPVDD